MKQDNKNKKQGEKQPKKKTRKKNDAKAIARIAPYKIKPKWQHMPTQAVRLPELLVPFLKSLALELDEKLFLIDDSRLPEETIEILFEKLSSERLRVLSQKIWHLIPKKEEQEKEECRKRQYRIEIKDAEPDSSKIAVYSPYDSTGERQRICKSIPGYSFDRYDKSWHFPLNAIAQVCETFTEDEYYWHPRLKDLLVQHQQKEQEEQRKRQRELERSLRREKLEKERFEAIIPLIYPKIDESLANGWVLRDYQRFGVKWLINRQRGGIYPGGILADDMGLGKTIEALRAAKLIQDLTPLRPSNIHIFVICPVSLIENWQREAERVGVKVEIFSNHYRKIPQPVNSRYIAIADEAHYFQNPKSARTKKIKELVLNENCLAAWLLTGTPIKNGSPINLYPLLEMCRHKLAEDKSHYIDRYCAPVRREFGKKSVWDITGAAHLDELSDKTKDVILRRTKKECLKELPDKLRLYKAIELESKEKKQYKSQLNELVADYRRRVKEGEVDEAAEALVTLNYIRKLNSQFKVESAIALAQELLEQGQQVILFTEFVESAKALYTATSELNNTELLTGDTKDRQGAVDRFQSGESKVFVGTIKAGGVGLTLTAASNVILVDRPWTPGDAIQAEDRAYRIGQQNAVFVYWISLGLVDKSIDRLIQQKQKNINIILSGENESLVNVNSARELALELMDRI
ncbi:MAG: DEAD/DEAH box helicase [Cyanobacteria bacterium P01_A01_bin.40]